MTTIHLTNWASRSLHGPGPRLTIMARPRWYEHGDGLVLAFVPPMALLDSFLDEWLSWEMYAARLRERWGTVPKESYAPGRLSYIHEGRSYPVPDGSTLCCSCARGAHCHRQIAAEVLAAAGWTVILDGVEVRP